MHDSTLIKLSILISIIGLLSLVIIDNTLILKTINIAEISEKNIDQKVKIKGKIIKIINKPNLKLLEIKDKTGKITAVTFSEEKLNIKKYQTLEITGKVSTYKDKLEIIIEKINTTNQ